MGEEQTLNIRVTPKASRNYIKEDTDEQGNCLIRVYVTCPPEDGKANKEVIKLLAKSLDIPKTSITITQGLSSRNKVIKIARN